LDGWSWSSKERQGLVGAFAWENRASAALIGGMQTEQQAIVLVSPASALAARPRLFAALEAAFPVTFRGWSAEAPKPPDAAALIAFAQDGRLTARDELAAHGLPVLALHGDADGDAAAEDFRLLSTPGVDARVRDVVLRDRLVGPALEGGGDEVLALADSGPAWTSSAGPTSVHRVRSVLEELGSDEVLYTLLSQRALAAVALIQFLRAVAEPAGSRPMALRATMHFDDPNLRWRSYGFINYRELLEHADAHGYHVAMATIPLDAGRPHRAAAALFRERPDRLSLVFHGNDHIKGELMAPKDVASATAVAAQALRRVARFERRSGLHVDRVMTPPHGMCSEHMTRALGALGFDALAAIYPRPWTDRFPADPPLAGWDPADWVGGCAVIPRIPLSSSVADIALRAFLDHPVVLYAHHEDVADGLEPLAAAAAAVNRLGDVHWMSMGEIATSNGGRRLAGECVVVRPFARRLRVAAEPGARTLRVEAPSDAIDERSLQGWSVDDGTVQPFGAEVPWPAGNGHVEVRLRGAQDLDASQVAAPAWRPWPKLRRAATEARDRLLPLRR
jgi:hypothetical protein